MKNRRNKGFVLLLVIMLIAMFGIIVSLLTEASNTMIFESNKTYLLACERNMIASGLAWSKINIQKDSRDIPVKMIELDVTEMNIRGSSLIVNTSSPSQNRPQVRIRTSCSRGRQTLTNDRTYTIGQ
jgi:type II secretory pathway component PulK